MLAKGSQVHCHILCENSPLFAREPRRSETSAHLSLSMSLPRPRVRLSNELNSVVRDERDISVLTETVPTQLERSSQRSKRKDYSLS